MGGLVRVWVDWFGYGWTGSGMGRHFLPPRSMLQGHGRSSNVSSLKLHMKFRFNQFITGEWIFLKRTITVV